MHTTEEIPVQCPHCGEHFSTVVDCSVESQEYVEDCQVCCQPIVMTVAVDEQDNISMEVRRENG
ncbi:MAG: CPXCG motif-containing cysteine-rich protein [Hahellaceae bacterium]|nr:CPXCG motif-containing cysteine-rich protein [Hahellaceae bacterium]